MTFPTKEDYARIIVRKDSIPQGGTLVEAYETEREVIVCGDPPPEPDGLSEQEYADWYEDSHNCDAMGCGTLSHVIYRFDKSELSRLRTERDWQTIGTAPKDGTNFLACSPASSVFFAHWADGVGAVDSSSWSDANGYARRYATHWMKLPEPPSEARDEKE